MLLWHISKKKHAAFASLESFRLPFYYCTTFRRKKKKNGAVVRSPKEYGKIPDNIPHINNMVTVFFPSYLSVELFSSTLSVSNPDPGHVEGTPRSLLRLRVLLLYHSLIGVILCVCKCSTEIAMRCTLPIPNGHARINLPDAYVAVGPWDDGASLPLPHSGTQVLFLEQSIPDQLQPSCFMISSPFIGPEA